MSTTTNPAPPVFSYAQAARGLQPVVPSSQKITDVSATSSEKGARGVQSPPTEEQKQEARSKSPDAKAGVTLPSTTDRVDESQNENQDWAVSSELMDTQLMKRPEAEVAEETKTTTSSSATTSLSESEPAEVHKNAETLTGQNGTAESWEPHSEGLIPTDKALVSNEKEKSQIGDSDWEVVSAPSVSQEKELKPAPAPPVNVWQQRKINFDAQRVQSSRRPTSSSGTPAFADSTKMKPRQERDATSKRKTSEAVKTAADKTGQAQVTQGPPSSRGQPSAQAASLPPPVEDAVAWPTPETAIEAEDRRKSSQDANEKPEAKPTGTKQQKKWTQVPFVPTAVFNTPLPPAAAKRGGRGSVRGGREGTGRGGHTVQGSISGDRNEVVGAMGPPPVPRHADQDRGRRPHPVQSGRATSVPTQERRATSAAATQIEFSKMSGTGQSASVSVAAGEPASMKAQESRSSSRPTDVSSKEVFNGNAEATEPSLVSENDHAHPAVDPAARAGVPSEWYSGKPANSSARPGEPAMKERGQPRGRTYQESRDKVESWRDQAPPSDTSVRRESRAERGGRGHYRPRGQNAGYVPVGTHANTAPLPQQPFAPQKSLSYNETRSRQSSNYTQHPSSGNGRSGLRSHSIPMQQQMMASNGTPLSPIQTDISSYGYQYSPMYATGAYMNAVPQHPALDMYALMSLVTAQLDYYFSIDNLCHDMYLRKHMDSQGFVSLRVIHGFKRMATMTPDLEILRLAASQSKVIEIRQGDDGEDRVRRREGWDQWVFANMEEREEGARNAGPSAQTYHPRRPAYGPMSAFAESPYSMGTPLRSPSWGLTGYNDMSEISGPGQLPQGMPNEQGPAEQAHQFQNPGLGLNGDLNIPTHTAAQSGHLRSSSSVSAVNGTESHSVANGHTGNRAELPIVDQENVFPNERISSVWVYARKGEDAGPPFASNATRTLSQGSRGGMDSAINGLTSPTLASGLRGELQVPSSKFHTGVFNMVPRYLTDSSRILRLPSQEQLTFPNRPRQNGVFFLKDGVSQSDFDREGSDPWPYEALHAKALEQRARGLHGAENHEMEILYQFWPTFLFQNFNLAMYNDFYRFALEDLDHRSTNGSKHLADYYGYQLAADKALPDQIAQDIVAAMGLEKGEARPIFQKVRAFWRDGSFNFKSRKRINDRLNAWVKEELAK